jgi:hypothetical protein
MKIIIQDFKCPSFLFLVRISDLMKYGISLNFYEIIIGQKKGKYCGIFAQSKNCGARETAVASECPRNNSGMSVARQQILDKEQLNSNRRTVFSIWFMPTGYELDNV